MAKKFIALTLFMTFLYTRALVRLDRQWRRGKLYHREGNALSLFRSRHQRLAAPGTTFQARTTPPSVRQLSSSDEVSNVVPGQEQTLVPGQEYESEYEVKKSRFIGYAKHVSTWDQATEYIAQIKQLHPKARHWCYGFRTGNSAAASAQPLSERCSDDGEPTGTAGAPILGAIQGQDLTNLVCVVVRYFGGIKLGAGGLIRAYGASARQVLNEAAPYEIVIPHVTWRVTVPGNCVGALYGLLGNNAADWGDETYHTDGSLSLSVSLVADQAQSFRNAMMDATRGQVQFSDA